MRRFMFAETENAAGFVEVDGRAYRPKNQKRCRECGGFHTPKCRPATRKQEAEIWRAILKK